MKVIERRSSKMPKLQYTEADWEEDSYGLFVEGIDPEPCPECGRTGFYGPRAADPGLKFRECRFCGFHQRVGEDPIWLRPVVHQCDDWPECAKAPYVWWVHPDVKRFSCPFCGQEPDVEARNVFTRGVLAERPVDDEDHPWRKVPQNRPNTYYQRFWENWEFTKGRVIL